MRAKIFITFFIFVGFGEALLTPEEIEARLQSLELANAEFEVEIRSLELSNTKLGQAIEVAKSENELNISILELSNTKLNQEVNHLKTQVVELLESKCENEMAECEYQPFRQIRLDFSLRAFFGKTFSKPEIIFNSSSLGHCFRKTF